MKIEIAEISGKWKVSQNRPAADIDQVVERPAGRVRLDQVVKKRGVVAECEIAVDRQGGGC